MFKQKDGKSFIFKLNLDDTFCILKSKIKCYEVCHYKMKMLEFGKGDLVISDDCNIYKNSYSNLGCNY